MFKNPRNKRGFTLIELLVVIFIIGLTLGWMTVKYHGKNKSNLGASEIMSKLAYQFALAKQEAIVNQREIIFTLKDHEYIFMFLDSDKPVLSEKLDEGLDIKIDMPVIGEPIVIYPNGVITPFRMSLNQLTLFVSDKGIIEHESNASKNK